MSIHIICHMISSVDGKLVSAKWSRPTHPVDISGVYESVASSFDAQGWIVGRTTMAEYDAGVREGAPAQTDEIKNKKAFKGNRNDRALAIVFDPKGKLHYSSDHLSTGEHIVSVLSDNLSDQYLQELRSVGVSYVFQGKGRTALSHALESIEKLFNVKTLYLKLILRKILILQLLLCMVMIIIPISKLYAATAMGSTIIVMLLTFQNKKEDKSE